LPERRFPPPRNVEETETCFLVRDANRQALGYFHFEDEPGWRSAANLLTQDEARRIAANIAKLPKFFGGLVIHAHRLILSPRRRQ